MLLSRCNMVLSGCNMVSLLLQVAELVKELRQELDSLLEEKIETPHMDLSTCPHGSRIIDTIVTLISTQ